MIPYKALLEVMILLKVTYSNFYSYTLKEDDAQLSVWLREKKYFSSEIVNEQIELMANSVLRSILSEIHSTCWFIIADEATDVRKCEQMCIGI